MEQIVTAWEIIPNPMYPEIRVEHPKSGRWYTALLFTQFSPANEQGRVYQPTEAQHVTVEETWAGGGRAEVTFNDGFRLKAVFGRRKPGIRKTKKPGCGGFNHRRQGNWRAARCNESE